MALHEEIKELLLSHEIIVSEWVLPSQGATKPPYAVVCDTEGESIYADGKPIFEVESVSVHLVYRNDYEGGQVCAKVDSLLKKYGYAWKKESLTTEKVMVKTYEIQFLK